MLVLRWPLVWLQHVALAQERIGACLVPAFGLATARCTGPGTYRSCLVLAFGLATARYTGPGTYRCLSCAGLLGWLQQVALG